MARQPSFWTISAIVSVWFFASFNRPKVLTCAHPSLLTPLPRLANPSQRPLGACLRGRGEARSNHSAHHSFPQQGHTRVTSLKAHGTLSSDSQVGVMHAGALLFMEPAIWVWPSLPRDSNPAPLCAYPHVQRPAALLTSVKPKDQPSLSTQSLPHPLHTAPA